LPAFADLYSENAATFLPPRAKVYEVFTENMTFQDTLDFMAYVAKDAPEIRACYVLECGGGLVQEVMTTIGQAFELRYKEYITKPLGLNA